MELTNQKIGIVGLGYVGLPLAVALASHVKVVGFDVSESRVEELRSGYDRNGEISSPELNSSNLSFTSQSGDLHEVSIFIVTVPTPVDSAHVPDLRPLISASQIVGPHLKKGDIVVYESTVYPGCTEEVCLPVLVKSSGLVPLKDFQVGYSPERINPGDNEHTLLSMVKIVSAQTDESLAILTALYGLVNGGRIHQASNIKTAEAAKVIENTQRDLNIALMNELSMLFHRLGISTQEVLAAAGTKWNFLKFSPGLVGGHCIPVDPYYLTHKAEMVGYHPEIILAGRRINDQMSRFIAYEIIKLASASGISPGGSNALILGATFKPDVRDLRNSQVFELVNQLVEFGLNVDVYDPVPDQKALAAEGVKVVEKPTKGQCHYKIVILATAHKVFSIANSEQLAEYLDPASPGIVVDLSGKLNKLISDKHQFWQL